MTKKTISLVTERRRLLNRSASVVRYMESDCFKRASEAHKSQTEDFRTALFVSLILVQQHIAQFGNRMHVAGGSSGAGRYRPRSLLGGKARYVGEVA